MKSIFLTLLSLGLLTACSSSRSAYSLGGEWDVVNLSGTAITPDAENTPWLGFDLNEGKIYGYTGCNRLNGGLDAKALFDGKASFDRLAMTQRICPEGRYEQNFVAALAKVTGAKTEKNEIKLLDKEGKEVMTLKKRK
ncbi:MAG: META domain-containing protein [Alloprevotella sp.]